MWNCLEANRADLLKQYKEDSFEAGMPWEEVSKKVKEILAELCREGSAVFFSTHVLEVAEKLCNKLAIIKEGKIVICGKTADVVGDDSLEDIFLELANHDA